MWYGAHVPGYVLDPRFALAVKIRLSIIGRPFDGTVPVTLLGAVEAVHEQDS